MELFRRLIKRGSTVIEIGAHIGYVAHYFSMLTGPQGRVFCFEPSPENLTYLKVNAARSQSRNISVVEAAAGDRDGTAPFFYETITGQNSTVANDFSGFEVNSQFNGLPADYHTCRVAMRRVDSFLEEQAIQPDFIKIDAEGGELGILRGMPGVLRYGTRVMVEMNTHHDEVYAILTDAEYALFNAEGRRVNSSNPEVFAGNMFAIHTRDSDGMAIMGTLK